MSFCALYTVYSIIIYEHIDDDLDVRVSTPGLVELLRFVISSTYKHMPFLHTSARFE